MASRALALVRQHKVSKRVLAEVGAPDFREENVFMRVVLTCTSWRDTHLREAGAMGAVVGYAAMVAGEDLLLSVALLVAGHALFSVLFGTVYVWCRSCVGWKTVPHHRAGLVRLLLGAYEGTTVGGRINDDVMAELGRLEETDPEVRVPHIVRKYVARVQRKLGIPKRSEANYALVRTMINNMYAKDDVRDVDADRYIDDTVELVFVPSDRALIARLGGALSAVVHERTELMGELRDTLQ